MSGNSKLRASVLIDLVDRFSAGARKMAGLSSKLGKGLAGAQAELKRLQAQAGRLDQLRALQSRLGKTAADMAAAKKRAAELGRALAATTKPTRKLSREFETARRKSAHLKKAHREQREAVRRLRGELRDAGIDTRNLAAAQKRLDTSMAAASKRMAAMRQQAQGQQARDAWKDRHYLRAGSLAMASQGVGNAGRGLLASIASPVMEMRQIQRARGELQSLGMDEQGVNAVVARARAASNEWAGISQSAFTAAAYDIRSGISSLDNQGVAAMTEMAALTAKATKADIAQMTSLFATAYGSFKETLYADMQDQEFGQIFSAGLAQSVEQFKTTGARMQQAVQSMGSGLATAGISLADQLTGLGLLQQKMDPGQAGTILKALERSAAKAEERFADMGLAIDTLDASGNLKNLPDLLETVQRELGDKYSSRIGAIIGQAFGTEEATDFFKALWGQQAAFREQSAAIEAASRQGLAFTRKIARRMDDNMDARLEVFSQRWSNIKAQIGHALIPMLERFLPVLERAGKGLAAFIQNNSSLVTVLAGVVAVAGLFAVAMAPLIGIMAGLTYALGALGIGAKKAALDTAMASATMGGKKGFGGKMAGLLKGKAGLVGAGIGALAVGATLLNDDLSAGEKAAQATREAGGMGGALAGMAAGAAAGSIIPGVGTLIGGLLGSIAGGMAGGTLADMAVGLFSDKDKPVLEIAQANGLNVLPAPALQPAGASVTQKVTYEGAQITVHAAPGMSEAQLAEMMAREQDEAQRRAKRRARGRMHDGIGGAY